ncbi:hypothetical protein ACQI4E_00835 [Streptomyces sp. CA-252508]|uniref:hypothetical protein n=1 Tax=Streptomyces sp. CA-252508 TaxID=3418946 RepID=UPI003D919A3E
MDAQQIAHLDDKQYEQLIVSNAHPPVRDPEIWAALTHPDNLARTRELMVHMHQRTGNTLRNRKAERDIFHRECIARGEAGRKAWLDSRAEYESWRRRAANFHQCIQQAIGELGKVQRTVNRQQTLQVGENYREMLRQLACAVHHHQATHAKAGGIADQADYELWRVLDRMTVPVGRDQEQVTLRTMLDIYWTDVTPVDEVQERRAEAERTMRAAPGGKSARYGGVPQARHVHNDKKLA